MNFKQTATICYSMVSFTLSLGISMASDLPNPFVVGLATTCLWIFSLFGFGGVLILYEEAGKSA